MAREIIEADLPKVKKLVSEVLQQDTYTKIERMGGLTNRTYKVTLTNGREYIIRIPGEGTEEMIVREDEKISTTLACDLGIDAKMLYFGEDGAKVTECIPDAITMNAQTMKESANIKRAAEIFYKLHNSDADTGVPFEVFDMAAGYEKIIEAKNVPMYDDYPAVKDTVMKIKSEVDRLCKIKKVPCHNDPLCENWVISGEGKMYLIDWEYAGMNDGMWDLADLSIEASYSREHDEELLHSYFGRRPDDLDWKRFLANKIYVDYLWTLWAKTRVPYDGQPMEDWATERYSRLKENIKEFENLK